MVKETELPSVTLDSIMGVVRVIAGAVGCDVSDPNYRVTGLTVFVISSISLYFVFAIHSVYTIIQEDWTYLLEACCIGGSAVQGVSKLLSGILQAKPISAVAQLLRKLYVEFEQKDEAYRAVLRNSCARLKRIIKLASVIYAISILGVIMVPFVMLLLKGERHLMMHFYIPGLDIGSNFGYFTTLSMHLLCMVIGGFGLFAGDLFVVIYLTQSILFVDIFALKVQELNERCDRGDKHVHVKLMELVKWHQFYTDYNANCNHLYYYIITTQILTSAIAILCAFFILITGNWPGVYSYLLLAISELYIYCILGTRIEIGNDDFCAEVYNIHWYKMPLSEQKIVCTMLFKSQQASTINVAGVLPLSVSTALKITKTVYSFIMMIVQFVDEEA